jgi:hypothetical protein
MKYRLRAFALHLLGSTCLLSLAIGGLYFGWYRWPGWYLTEVTKVLALVVLVDLALGPTLTFLVAAPKKQLQVLARDIAIIVTVQLAALVYGWVTLWQGRPLYYTFSVDRLEIVQASDLKRDEIAQAQRDNPALAPHWYSRPRWIYAPLPDDPAMAARIVNGAVFGGDDIIDMPRYFKPWDAGLPKLRSQLQAVAELKGLNKAEKQHMEARLSTLGLSPGERNAIVMWGAIRRALVIFDPETLKIRVILRVS